MCVIGESRSVHNLEEKDRYAMGDHACDAMPWAKAKHPGGGKGATMVDRVTKAARRRVIEQSTVRSIDLKVGMSGI